MPAAPELPGVPFQGTDAPQDPKIVELGSDLTVWVGAERDARLIHKEIFTDNCYDIAKLSASPFIIDAGANIGLFTLWAKKTYPAAQILSFEPVPQIFDLLNRNLKLYDVSTKEVQTHAVALGAESKPAKSLTYFPNAPGNSTFMPSEKDLLRKALPEDHLQRMIDRSEAGATKVDVPLERLSHFLDQFPDLDKIDMLKVDVESWELDVLKGIDDRHWAMVQNAAVEVSELSGLREDIEALLTKQGFSIERQLATWSYKAAPTHTLVARRGVGPPGVQE